MHKLTAFEFKPFNVVHASLMVVLLVLAIIGFVRILPTLFRVPEQIDFAAYYLAGQILDTGTNLYDEEALKNAADISGLTHYTGYIYLPFLAILFRPLTLLPYSTAATLWLTLNLALLILSMILLGMKFRLSKPAIILLICGYLILPSTYETLLLGQFAIVMNTLLVAVLILTGSDRPSQRKDGIAGILLGIAVVVKVYLAVIGLVFLLHRRFGVLISASVTVMILLLLGVLAGGWDNTWQWFSTLENKIFGETLYMQ